MTDILNLPSLTILEVRENIDDILLIAEVKKPLTACPHCKSTNFKKHGGWKGVWMDVPMRGKRTGIRLEQQRYYCKDCKKSFSEPLPDFDTNHRMTRRLVDYIRQQSLRRTFVSIAEEIGKEEGTIRYIFNQYAVELQKEFVIETPEWLGIDELKLCGKPRCVLTNPKEKKLLDILKTRSKTAVTRFLMTIPGRKAVKLVTMDMWDNYREAVNSVLPDAVVVVDKFHIQRMANKALDDARKKIRETLTPEQRKQWMPRGRIVLGKLGGKDFCWLCQVTQVQSYRLKQNRDYNNHKDNPEGKMGLSIELYVVLGKEVTGNAPYRLTVFEGDITHNLVPMWNRAGVYDALYESQGECAGNILEVLRNGLADMEQNADVYRSLDPPNGWDENVEVYRLLNPPNGWGDYDGALRFLREFSGACEKYPKARIEVWK
jgi:transposase-like protein